MRVLGIETSCDETAVALLECTEGSPPIVLAEEIASQSEVHAPYGGVVPELASRAHLKNLPLLVEKVCKDSGIDLHEVQLIGVTRGPGLKGCLLVGLSYAKALHLATGIPIVGVNHIEGHLVAPMLDNPDLQTPYLALVVSGGHTEIVHVRAFGDYSIIARTIDDAAGEAFDKAAHLLGFEYPGGPRLAACADDCAETLFTLPKVMREADGFSFSGLKTAIALLIKKHMFGRDADLIRRQLARTVQSAIIDALCFKVHQAVKSFPTLPLVVTGGVAANRELRKQIAEISKGRSFAPDFLHCMDNAGMIAYGGWLRFLRGEVLPLDADVLSRWPVETIVNRQ